MAEKYIPLSAALSVAAAWCPDDDGSCPKAGHDLRELLDDLENAPPANVRPVKLINAGIETALQILDGINEEGWLPNPVYRELHDAISVIGEYAQNSADMRPEPEKERSDE